MLSNFVKVAVRNLRQKPVYTLINVAGLGGSLAFGLILLALYWQKTSFETEHPAHDRLYEVVMERPGVPIPVAQTPKQLTVRLQQQSQEVEASTRVKRIYRTVTQQGNAFGHEALYAEPSFFDLFGFPLTRGDPDEALSEPHTAVLTEEMARRVFGTEDVVGKTITFASEAPPVTITGTVRQQGIRSHVTFDALYSSAGSPALAEGAGAWSGVSLQSQANRAYGFVRLREGAAPDDLQPLLDQFGAEVSEQLGEEVSFGVTSMRDVALGNLVAGQIGGDSMPWFVLAFFGILAVVVLLNAMFNYVNLAVAQSQARSGEIGVRKTLGARPIQVATQFLAESVVLATLSFFVSVGVLAWLIPGYNQLQVVQVWQERLIWETFLDPWLWAAALGICLITGVLAGAYPAFRLSKFRPVGVLRGAPGQSSKGGEDPQRTFTLRRLLIVTQLTVTVVFMVTAVTLYRQSSYALDASYGYDATSAIAVENVPEDLPTSFLRRVSAYSSVQRTAGASSMPLSGERMTREIGDPGRDSLISHTFYSVGPQYFSILDVDVIAGDLSEFATSNGIVLNAVSTKELGFSRPESAVGKTVLLGESTAPILAVTENFHYSDMRSEIEPLAFRHDPDAFHDYVFEITGANLEEAKAKIKDAWETEVATSSIEIRTLQEIQRERYAVYSDTTQILGAMSGFAVLIAILGLMGITAHSVQSRRREIGIRKAVGATTMNVTVHLLKESGALVGVALLVSLPLAYLLNTWWLQKFAYRIEIGSVTFGGAALMTIALTLGTAGYLAHRAASQDVTSTLQDV